MKDFLDFPNYFEVAVTCLLTFYFEFLIYCSTLIYPLIEVDFY